MKIQISIYRLSFEMLFIYIFIEKFTLFAARERFSFLEKETKTEIRKRKLKAEKSLPVVIIAPLSSLLFCLFR